MKLSVLLAALTATLTIASPAAISLKRAERSDLSPDGLEFRTPCIECPCDGWDGPCRCVANGCCC